MSEATRGSNQPENPYARTPEAIQEPPVGFGQTLKFLGPGLILVGSVVGSGEIILTTTLGATVGFTMFWWMLLSCWGKSIIQAELGRYTISSGETVLWAFNRLPGKLPSLKGNTKVSWFIWVWILYLIPSHMTGGGIYGGAGQALNLAFPAIESTWWTVVVAALTSGIILTGTYRFLEKLLIVMVVTFTFITLTCAVLLQLTPYAITWTDFQGGFTFEFPAMAVAVALGTPLIEEEGPRFLLVERGIDSHGRVHHDRALIAANGVAAGPGREERSCVGRSR